MTLFGRSSYLDPDVEDWHFETWAWLMRGLGGVAQLKWSPLILPERRYFPPTTATGHDRQEHIFTCVRRMMGATDLDCVLAHPEAPQAVEEDGGEEDGGDADNAPLVITYTLDASPVTTVSEMAHGLAAIAVHQLPDGPPGGDDMFWPACSLAVAYRGLGIFGANAAYEVVGTVGRSVSRTMTGYVSELTWSLALATYLALTDRRGEATRWLDTVMAPLVHDAERYLERHPQRLDALKAVP